MKNIRRVTIFFGCLLIQGLGQAGEGTQILYSINMPGNPFQQPYYQMMIKSDSKNSVYSFTSATQPQLPTFNACSVENGCGTTGNNQTMVTSDYVSLYASSKGGSAGTAGGNSFLSFMYGLTPYVFRGYVEGSAHTLFMQRPAQVQLPFNPLAQIQLQNQTTPTYMTATLPDYSDVFLSQKSSDIYQSVGCSIGTCGFGSNSEPLPSWYTYIQKKAECGGGVFRGFSLIFYGKMSSLDNPSSVTTLVPYHEALGAAQLLPSGLSYQSKFPVTNPWNFPIVGASVFNMPASWSRSCIWNYSFNTPQFMLFAPIISPGYAGENQNGNEPAIQTVLASGDLSGNYSISNSNNPYIAAGNPATTYDGISLTSGMSYFQLFAQNMQWFSLPASQATPLAPLSATVSQNITPGQGIFSDALQIAAMEAPLGTSQTPVFTGSVGATAGITGPVLLRGAAPLPGSNSANPINFTVPQAFLSELTTQSFKVGNYLQVPLGTQLNGTWSGGLVQAATEDPLQYYQGVTPLESKLSLMPYLPLYFSDPGLQVWGPGGSYCPLSLFNQTPNAQVCYDTGTSPMTNFHSALNGTR
jgi:hypothetical protein